MENINAFKNTEDPKDVLDAVALETKRILSDVYDRDNDFSAHDAATEFAKKIKLKYPDYENYKMYHVLTFSSLDKNNLPTKFDFPDKDNIADFIRSL